MKNNLYFNTQWHDVPVVARLYHRQCIPGVFIFDG